MSLLTKSVWLIGTSQMAVDYYNVLKNFDVDVKVIGRGARSADFFKSATDITPIVGGVENLIGQTLDLPDCAIIAVGVEEIKNVAIILLQAGVKCLLLEKPGGLNVEDVSIITKLALETKSNVLVGYNRRFFSSVIQAKAMIEEDGGLESFNFDFTEWGHIIKDSNSKNIIKNNWFLCNSTHLIDLAFYIGGLPVSMSTFSAGNSYWHTPMIFSGAGISNSGAIFSYSANWGAPGRWSVEFLTKRRKYILRPIEKLQIQEIGSLSTEFVPIDDELDINYKPGLYRQTLAFLNNDFSQFNTISEQLYAIKNFYLKMSNV